MSNTDNLTYVYPVLRRYVAEFIKDFATQDNNGWKSKALRKKYLFSETDTDDVPMDKDLAKLLGVTSESVRNIKVIAARFCNELYARKDEAFLLMKGIKRVEVKGNLMKRFGFRDDEKTLMFYLDGMGYSVTDQKNLGCYCVDTKYYGKGLTGILREVIPDIKDIMDSNPVPVRLEDVLDQFKLKESDMIRLKFAEDYMLADSDTFEVTDKDGDVYVSMRWGSLPSATSRQVRILYDFACQNGFDAFMTKVKLVNEYNTRAYMYSNIDPIPMARSVVQDDHIEFGGNGTYRYTRKPVLPSNPKNNGKGPGVDIKEELLKYLAAHNGIASFDDLRKYVDDNGWKYRDKTIKDYMGKGDSVAAWKKGSGKKTYYILKTYWPTYQQRGYYLPKVGHGSASGTTKIPPAYKVAIVNKAIGLLKAAPGNTIRIKELVDSVADLYPQDSITNIYKIFDGEPAIVKTDDGQYTLADSETVE